MKVVFTLIFTLLVGFTAMAQSAKREVKVETITMKVELNVVVKNTNIQSKQIARVYLNKNYRVEKELNFTTKRNSAKIA